MKEIPKYLLEKIVSFTQGIITVEQFEAWLYQQEELSDQILSDEFILELYSFNYARKDVNYVLEKFLIENIGEEYFQSFQIKESLDVLTKSQNNCQKILDLFNSLAMYDDYNFLSGLGYCYYDMEEYNRFNQPDQLDIKRYIYEESKILLEQVTKVMDEGCRDLRKQDFESADVTYDRPYECYRPSPIKNNSTNTKKEVEKVKKASWWSTLFQINSY